jgi:3'-phosphoadenosine 5'-phosphosulfate sulfotransferase (PAPS reductase)/FAD synthetase
MKHIVFYSGGIGSWATAKRVINKHGEKNIILLFTDTLIEDEDLYRFLKETSEEMKCEFVYLKDGRNVWEVFRDVRYIGNSRIAQCSHILKQKVAKQFILQNFKHDECTLYLGIDWTEEHRTKAPIENWKPYKVLFPMCEAPYLTKEDMLKLLDETGVKRPRLYDLGFSHNNCGGFCVRAGQGHFINLLQKMPERYAYHEQKEQEMIDFLGKKQSILRKNSNGKRENLTLRELREQFEQKPKTIDMFDIGGCGCFVSDEVNGE